MDFYLGQVCYFAIPYAPQGWALCNGQLLPIKGNEALFTLLGTAFGGDGRVNFALPDLRGRVPVGVNNPPVASVIDAPSLGAKGGSPEVTIPAGTATASVDEAAGSSGTPVTVQKPAAETVVAVPPFLGLQAMICTQGLYPPRP